MCEGSCFEDLSDCFLSEIQSLRDSPGPGVGTKNHAWKQKKKSKLCDYCVKMCISSHYHCNGCKYSVHDECRFKVPAGCTAGVSFFLFILFVFFLTT